jgi:hypothetical protein
MFRIGIFGFPIIYGSWTGIIGAGGPELPTPYMFIPFELTFDKSSLNPSPIGFFIANY